MYWNINEILPFQRNFNFINGERSIGKTYTTLKYFIKKCLDKKWEFIYIVRTQEEKKLNALENAVKKVTANEFSNINFCYTFENMYVEIAGSKIVIGHCIALSEAIKVKKYSYPNVKFIIFDEYMLEAAHNKSYVNGWKEPDLFLSIYHTVDREEDRVICFLLGNNTSFYNPYHLHHVFNIPNIEKGNIWKNKYILFQWAVASNEHKLKKESVKFLQMIQGSQYGNYAKDGNYIDDKDAFVKNRSKTSKYVFTLKYNDFDFGIWQDNLIIYVDNKIDPSCKIIYAINLNAHDSSTKLIKNGSMIKWIADNYKNGNVRFSNMKIKKYFVEVLKYIL